MITYLVLGLLGVVLYMLHRIISIKKDLETLNQQFIFSKFFAKDWPYMAVSVTLILVFALLKDEVINYKPEIEGWLKASFLVIGWFGTMIAQIIQSAVGFTSKKYVRSVMDDKSNIADDKTNQP